MTKKKATKKASSADKPISASFEVPPIGNIGSDTEVETTGRFIVVFKDRVIGNETAVKSALNNVAGISNIAMAADFDAGALTGEDLADSEVVYFNNLGMAVVSSEEAMLALAASTSDANSPILAIEPEYIFYLSSRMPGQSWNYLRGYRDAVNHLYEQLTSEDAVSETATQLSASFADTAQFTWGLQATRVTTSRFSGRGVKIAVLDTGLDLEHPDFIGRDITSMSFVTGIDTVQDIPGHGTHCVGTACGSQRPATGVRRYGVAFDAQIFVGKVFNNAQPRPQTTTTTILNGIEWAIANGCQVASLSFGMRVNQQHTDFEAATRRALNAGTLVVAAAGNNANRPGLAGFNPNDPPTNGFVEIPANADAALAVAAVDSQLRVAGFSARSSLVTGVGGIVNIAAPGVSVFSSVPVNRGRHDFSNGTSMATPHVAGIAALWAEATGETGLALWNRLVQSVLPLDVLSSDVGAGLVQAPQ